MVEKRKFFSIYGSFFIVYLPIYLIFRFFTVFVFGNDWNMGALEWILISAVVIIFLQFVVTIFIPKSIMFVGDIVLGKNN